MGVNNGQTDEIRIAVAHLTRRLGELAPRPDCPQYLAPLFLSASNGQQGLTGDFNRLSARYARTRAWLADLPLRTGLECRLAAARQAAPPALAAA